MKKKIAFGLVLCMLFAFSACSTPNDTLPSTTNTEPIETTDKTNPTTEATLPALDIAQLPMLSVALPIVSNTAYAENADPIFNYIYQNMALVTPDPEVADKIIVDFLNRIDTTTSTADTLEEEARSAYSGNVNWTPYLCQYTYEPMRIDGGILSLFGTYAIYSGASHPDVTNSAVTYSMVTGEVLNLEDILSPNASAEALCSLVIKALAPQKEALYEGYEDTVKERFSFDFMQDTGWYLSEGGLCYYFSPREIAGYVSGVITAEIPYDQLVGIIDDSRFPAEQDICTGSIYATSFDDADLSQYDQFTEITLTENSKKILLHTDGSVRNIRVESGYWNADGSVYTPEFTLLALSTLTPGDAIMIETELSNALPPLRLTYQSDEQLVTAYISEDMLSGN